MMIPTSEDASSTSNRDGNLGRLGCVAYVKSLFGLHYFMFCWLQSLIVIVNQHDKLYFPIFVSNCNSNSNSNSHILMGILFRRVGLGLLILNIRNNPISRIRIRDRRKSCLNFLVILLGYLSLSLFELLRVLALLLFGRDVIKLLEVILFKRVLRLGRGIEYFD